ncbi:MAG: heavy-metal-associated domain-containing protein [Pirellula sp.]|jgi:copper chaperone CopZ|nr:heavy metal-associated domain-containing protein [Planctomycetota bacterium]
MNIDLFSSRPAFLLLAFIGALSGCTPATTPKETATATAVPSEKETLQDVQNADVHTVAIRVNTMSCIEGCFNGIRSVIEKRDGIESVKLAPQKEEGLIDNSMIYVSYRGDLDRKEIERLIIGAGFDGIEFIENGSE